ncbi:MAG: sortase [Patescibacteria group bacterium]|nr:sortase [Patescibacteria group bacterium]
MKEARQLWKFFVFFFLISFLIINFNEVSLVFNYFNYKVIWERISKPSAILHDREELPTEINASNSEENTKESSKENFKENFLEIPKIGVLAPIILSKATEEKELEKTLKRGVLLYPDSVRPGEKGKTIILGHSAPPNWPDINYDRVFNNLDKLEKGDEVVVYFNQKKYLFEVFEKKIFLPKEEEEILATDERGSSLILLTCWPPGKDFKRLAVLTKLLK